VDVEMEVQVDPRAVALLGGFTFFLTQIVGWCQRPKTGGGGMKHASFDSVWPPLFGSLGVQITLNKWHVAAATAAEA